MTSTYSQIRAGLFDALKAALVAIENAPPLELAEPSLADPSDQDDNRFRAVLMPVGREPDSEQLATPPPWAVTARFVVGLHGVQGQAVQSVDREARKADRIALLDAMTTAIAGVLDTNWSLGGLASFAQTEALDEDHAQQSGFPPESLLELQISVQFDAPTRLG